MSTVYEAGLTQLLTKVCEELNRTSYTAQVSGVNHDIIVCRGHSFLLYLSGGKRPTAWIQGTLARDDNRPTPVSRSISLDQAVVDVANFIQVSINVHEESPALARRIKLRVTCQEIQDALCSLPPDTYTQLRHTKDGEPYVAYITKFLDVRLPTNLSFALAAVELINKADDTMQEIHTKTLADIAKIS